MKGKKKAHTHTIPRTSGLKKPARGLVRSRSTIGLQAVRHPSIQRRVIAGLTSDIQKEMTELCAKKTRSFLKQSSVTAISEFSLEALAEELERVTSTSYAILKICVSVTK